MDGTDGDDTINLSDKPGKHFIVAGPGNDTIGLFRVSSGS